MFNKRFLTQGEKLKELRKTLDVTQKELARNNIARSTIALIEAGGKLYKEAAKNIVENAFIIASEKGVDQGELSDLTVDLLIETDEKQINRIIDCYLEEIRLYRHNKELHLVNESLDGMRNFIDSSKFDDLEKMSELTDILIEEFLLQDDSYYYLLKGVEIASKNKNYKEIVNFYSKIIKVKFGIGEYKTIINDGKYALNIAEQHNIHSESIQKILYNCAMAYKKQGNYNECINLLNHLRENYNLPHKRVIDIECTLADCNIKLNNDVVAEEMLIKNYNDAKSGTSAQLMLALANICLFYADRGKFNTAVKYADILEQMNFEGQDIAQLAKNVYYMTMAEIKLDRDRYVKHLYPKCLDFACEAKNELVQYKLLFEVTSYFIIKDDKAELERIAELINMKVCDKEIPLTNPKIAEILSDLSDYFENVNEKVRKKINTYSSKIRRIGYIHASYVL